MQVSRGIWARVAILASLTGLYALAAASPAAAADVPDASCPGPVESQATIGGTSRFGQTFTALGSGELVRVQVALYEEDAPGAGGPYEISINTTGGDGLPTDTELASTSIPDAAVAPGHSLADAVFAAPASVIAGQRYAIVITRPTADQLGAGIREGNDCATGAAYLSFAPSGPFEQFGPDPDMVDIVFNAFLAGPEDTDPPETTITKQPKDKSPKKKAKYKFTSDEAGSTFECKIDKKPWEACTSPKKFKAKPGKHKFKVRAIDPAGNVDPTPAKDKFKVTD
jgi:hypothetical protein